MLNRNVSKKLAQLCVAKLNLFIRNRWIYGTIILEKNRIITIATVFSNKVAIQWIKKGGECIGNYSTANY